MAREGRAALLLPNKAPSLVGEFPLRDFLCSRRFTTRAYRGREDDALQVSDLKYIDAAHKDRWPKKVVVPDESSVKGSIAARK